ncbi:MAG: DUF429 domain-containing protein [Candidatus Aenigmatarchaeota archaeon]
MKVVGIDLAGSEKRNTGFCLLKNDFAKVEILKKDNEIIEKTKKEKPLVIAIDAPLSLPKGRKSIEEIGPHFRKCDLELKKFKIKFFPITIGPMRKLTERGMRIKNELEKLGFKVIETFPGAVYDLLKIERKNKEKIYKFFSSFFKINKSLKEITLDELDSIACAYVAKLYLENKVIELGDKDEGTLIIPKL